MALYGEEKLIKLGTTSNDDSHITIETSSSIVAVAENDEESDGLNQSKAERKGNNNSESKCQLDKCGQNE